MVLPVAAVVLRIVCLSSEVREDCNGNGSYSSRFSIGGECICRSRTCHRSRPPEEEATADIGAAFVRIASEGFERGDGVLLLHVRTQLCKGCRSLR